VVFPFVVELADVGSTGRKVHGMNTINPTERVMLDGPSYYRRICQSKGKGTAL